MARSSRKPTVVSMFSGCGGLDLGLKQAGYELLWANDFDQDACETYKANLGEIEYGDIREVKTPEIKDLDLLVAGFPCQPFSSAGNRKGIHDTRGMFFQTTLDYIEQLSPKAVLIENVRGLLSAKIGNQLLIDYITKELERMGYSVRYKLLNFSDFGVPQLRMRVVLIALKDGRYLDFMFPESKRDKDLSIKSTLKGLTTRTPNQNEIMRLNPQALEIGQHVPEGGSWKDIPTKFLPERLKKIRKDMKKYGSPVIYRRCSRHAIMSTVTAAFKPENAAVWHPWEPRIFSVREIARFQGFPDDFVFHGKSVKSKYQQIGNAVPPIIGKLFGEHLKLYFNKVSISSLRSQLKAEEQLAMEFAEVSNF